MPLIYDELHRLAHQYMRREGFGHTLQTSALVNEAFLGWWIKGMCIGKTGRTFSVLPLR